MTGPFRETGDEREIERLRRRELELAAHIARQNRWLDEARADAAYRRLERVLATAQIVWLVVMITAVIVDGCT